MRLVLVIRPVPSHAHTYLPAIVVAVVIINCKLQLRPTLQVGSAPGIYHPPRVPVADAPQQQLQQQRDFTFSSRRISVMEDTLSLSGNQRAAFDLGGQPVTAAAVVVVACTCCTVACLPVCLVTCCPVALLPDCLVYMPTTFGRVKWKRVQCQRQRSLA